MTDKRTFKVAFMLLTIFVAGGFCGWWIGSNAVPEAPTLPPQGGRRPAMAQKEIILAELTKELSLDREQRERVDKVLTEWAREIQRANVEQLRSKMATFEKYMPFVRTNLTGQQQKIYDSMTDQARRKNRRAMQNQ
jgi:hypothetical protein